MKISIYDRGPIGAKVDALIDGKSVAFPEHSLRSLIDLFTLLEATPDPGAVKGVIHFSLNDPVQAQAFRLEQEANLRTIEILTDDNKRLDYLLKSAVQEQQNFFAQSLWKRIRYAMRRHR